MRLGRSLTGRLTLSMALILCSGLAVIAGLHALEETGRGLGSRLGRLLLGDELPEPWQDLAVLVPFGALIVALINVVCSWSLRPLLRASAEAARVGAENPGVRIGTNGLPSELSPLVAAVNAALDRLARAFEIERRFTMNAAHELRTPLATLSLRLQRVRHDGVAIDWPVVERDIAVMNSRIERLLDLARKEGAGGGQTLPVNLCRVVRAAAAQMLPLVEVAKRELRVDLPDRLPVLGDADDLQDMVRNLIENALMHGEGRIDLSGGTVAAAASGTDRPLVMVLVTDQGTGVAPDLRDAVFERFRKGEQASLGSGLGLSIVREVVRRHGGNVAFVPAPTCTVRVVLPAAAT